MKDLGTTSMIEDGTENHADKDCFLWKACLVAPD